MKEKNPSQVYQRDMRINSMGLTLSWSKVWQHDQHGKEDRVAHIGGSISLALTISSTLIALVVLIRIENKRSCFWGYAAVFGLVQSSLSTSWFVDQTIMDYGLIWPRNTAFLPPSLRPLNKIWHLMRGACMWTIWVSSNHIVGGIHTTQLEKLTHKLTQHFTHCVWKAPWVLKAPDCKGMVSSAIWQSNGGT